jgi:hypothetical protein
MRIRAGVSLTPVLLVKLVSLGVSKQKRRGLWLRCRA